MEPEGYYTPIYHGFWPATAARRPTTNNSVYFDIDYLNGVRLARTSLLKEAISQKRRQLKALQKELADLERELREIT